MIGNDVVDVPLARVESEWKRQGFLAKVYSDLEQKIIYEAPDKNLMVWIIWSMKEAAYKAHQRAFNLPRQLNWQDYECTILSSSPRQTRGLVKNKGTSYGTITVTSPDYIHTTATSKPNLEVDSFCKLDTGKAMERRLLKLLSYQLNLPITKLYFEKNYHGVPSVFYAGEKIFNQFSFSGHGRFNALSVALTNY